MAESAKDSPQKVLVSIAAHSAVDVVESVVRLSKSDGFVSFTADVADVLLSLRDDHGSLICTRKATK